MSILAKGEYTVSPVSDGLVGSQGPAGADAYTVVLTNESHVFPGDVANALAGSTETQVTALKGATQVAATIGTITGHVTGLTTAIANNGTTSAKVTITVTTQMATSGGILTIPITVDGKSFTKKFSFSIGYKGGVGKSVESITEYYLASASASGVTTATAGWTTTMQDLTSVNKYLWNYEKITYSNPSSTVNTTPVIIGIHGPQGIQGPGGISVVSVDVWYYLSTSSSSLVGGSWSTTSPAWVNGRYMWSKTITTYSSGSPTESTPVCITGAAGSTGQAGKGVSSLIEEFYLSTSKATPTGGSWLTSPPAWTPGKYMWTRSKITYTDPPSVGTTEPMCDSSWEAVNAVKVGGRNFCRNTNKGVLNWGWSMQTGDSTVASLLEDGVDTCLITRGAVAQSGWSVIRYSDIGRALYEPNVEYIVSFDVKSSVGGSFSGQLISLNGTNQLAYALTAINATAIANQWSRIILPIKTVATLPSNIDQCLYLTGMVSTPGVTHQFKNLKIERGNKATDWSSAPEDVDAKIDEVGQNVSEANEALDQIISSTTTKQAELSAQINTLNLALSSLSAGVGENNASTQGAIDSIQAMIAALEAQRSALSDKVASLEQAKIKTDNYIQIGTVKLSNGTTVFGVAVGKDVNILNPDGTISTFERSMTATTANEFMILTGGTVVGVFDATGMTSESVKVNKIVVGNRFEWSMTASNAMVLKKGG